MNIRRCIGIVACTLLAAACGGGSSSSSSKGVGSDNPEPGVNQDFVEVDLHTYETPPLAEGEIELLTLSTFPETVSGGDVLVAVRGVSEDATPHFSLNGQEIFPDIRHGDNAEQLEAMIVGLQTGDNVLAVEVGEGDQRRRVEIILTNHPITGPIISGPHQSPFACRTVESGLGEPLDENCSIATTYEWFYRRLPDLQYAELDPNADAYPPDMQTTVTRDGESLPFIVRVESATINRGIARIAVLDDPIARGGPTPFTPSWNRRVYYIYGESCDVGYHQGSNSPNFVLGAPPDIPAALQEGLANQDPEALAALVDTGNLLINLVGGAERLGKGDIVVHSTLSAFGVHCNPFVSLETTMMLKEHIIEDYGVPHQFIGTNGSGAALQQYNAANSAPGLLTGAMPTATFSDIASTAMTVVDCGLLVNYFDNSEFDWSTPDKRAAVTGHNVQSSLSLGPVSELDPSGESDVLNNEICKSWISTFFDKVQAQEGCGNVPEDLRYHPQDNPAGARCTVQDANVNWLGTEPHPDHPNVEVARRPLDNIGVQYGLEALKAGAISAEEFIDLNRQIGGLDIDGNFVSERHAMSEELSGRLYQIGQVIGRGYLAETPVMDIAPYLDVIPLLNIHESVRPFTIRARLNAREGREDTHVIWRGVLTQPDAFETMDAWTEAIRQNPSNNRVNDVASLRPMGPAAPYGAVDSCSISTLGGQLDLPNVLLLPLGGQVPILADLGLPGMEVPIGVNAPETWEADGSGSGPCANALPVVQTPRMVAGMPMSGDVIKCQLKAIDPADYNGLLDAQHLAELVEIFPDGVCDYDQPGVGDLPLGQKSLRWPSVGGTSLFTEGGTLSPRSLQWRAVRSSNE
ncbi:hypothetical protein I6N98_08020 [Spongiibacter nanhainus]|uniref:DUF6351 domain-containing protein n=1 Tax=Spongiibacter nanhainus TaxID=2794344 RepID=A0A7T4R3V4_9GAMM|nr:DUF6351 family protein [Spongiibacter nanhainus]QQD19774.1 hypothetical protein I6N98_08020 [Spongiibacter nanhainus]